MTSHNGTVEITDIQTKQNCNRGIVLGNISRHDSYCIKSSVARALTGEKPCINKAIQALLMLGYATFNMIVPGPQICCRCEMCTARP